MQRLGRLGILTSLALSLGWLGFVVYLTSRERVAPVQPAQPAPHGLTWPAPHRMMAGAGVIRGVTVANGLVQSVSPGLIQNGDIGWTAAGGIQVLDQGGQVFNVLAYGADPTGVANSTTAVNAAITAASAGGTVFFPQGYYKLTGGQIALGLKPITIAGVGSTTRFGGHFGDSGWQTQSNFTGGSILYFDASGDGIGMGVSSGGNTICNGVRLSKIALVGPGSGSASGINHNCSAGGDFSLDDIAIYNFSNGLTCTFGLYESVFLRPTIWSCSNGLNLVGDCADLNFYGVNLRLNSKAIYASQGQEIRFIGGKIESNTNYGVHVAPPSNAQKFIFHGIGFENNTNGAVLLDTSGGGGINNFTIRDCGFAGAVDKLLFAGSLPNLINSLTVAGCEAPGLAAGPTLTSNVVNCLFLNNGWPTAPVDNGSHNVIIEANNSLAKFGSAGNINPQGTAMFNGLSTTYALKTSIYGLTGTDSIIAGDASGGAFAINLIPAASVAAGREYTFKKIDSSGNAITLTPNGADTIDGAASQTLGAQWKYLRVVSDGASKWLIVGSN